MHFLGEHGCGQRCAGPDPDARRNADKSLTIFDNGASGVANTRKSRGLVLDLDEKILARIELLAKAKMKLSDIDLFELNEAFASQSLPTRERPERGARPGSGRGGHRGGRGPHQHRVGFREELGTGRRRARRRARR